MGRTSFLRKKYPPFETLSRKKRGNAFVSLRQRILREKPMYGGMFSSHLVMDEPGRPSLYNQWFDFFFLGKRDKFTIWNAYILTAQSRFWDDAQEVARERARALMSEEEQKKEFSFDSEPCKFDAWGKPTMYRMITKDYTYPQFNGLGFYEYCRELEQEIIIAEPPVVYERFELDRSYRYGIGLHITVDADEITQSVIEQAIERFWDLGETDWVSETPVLRDRLPVKTEHAALTETGGWTPGIRIREEPSRKMKIEDE